LGRALGPVAAVVLFPWFAVGVSGCGESCEPLVDAAACMPDVTFAQVHADLKVGCLLGGCHNKVTGNMSGELRFFGDPNDAAATYQVLLNTTPAAGGVFLDRDEEKALLYRMPASATHGGGQLLRKGDRARTDRIVSWLRAGYPGP
jgi:hypothetical protein